MQLAQGLRVGAIGLGALGLLAALFIVGRKLASKYLPNVQKASGCRRNVSQS